MGEHPPKHQKLGTETMSASGIQNKSTNMLEMRAAELTQFSAACLFLAETLRAQLVGDDEDPRAPGARVSMAQVAFFMIAGTMDVTGKDPTFTSVHEALGDKVGQSVRSTYSVFFEPDDRQTKRLGWLTTEPSRRDNRVKFLRLTEKGRVVLKNVLHLMSGDDI